MSLTNEQIKQIIDGAPDGATHWDLINSCYLIYENQNTDYHPTIRVWDKHHNSYSVYSRSYGSYWQKDLSDLAEILALRERVEQLEQGGWISVDDRLPEIDEFALWLDGKQSMGHHQPFVHVDKINKRGECLVNYLHNYTHWQPLPQPPKENTNDN